MIEPNVLAFQNAALLDAIEEAPNGQWTVLDLARHLDRDDSNTGKTLRRLTAEGILLDPPLSGLTDEGRAQLAAYKRAKHGGERRRSRGRWPLDKLRRNPLNRKIDPEAVLGLADTIGPDGVGDILMPLVLSPPDEDGVRTIWAGERRWMAATRLLQIGQLPDALLEGVPFTERAATPGEAALIAIVENTARADLSPWEDALQLRAAADELKLNATDLARRSGRARDGDRGGLRDVQSKIKVAREATREAIAAYEADPTAPGAWETLRDSVSRPKAPAAPEIVTTRAQRLALAELLHKAGGKSLVDVAILPGAFSAEGQRLVQYELANLHRSERGDVARVTASGLAYLQTEGLSGSIENARHQLGFPESYGVAAYRTEWLNTPLKADWREVERLSQRFADAGGVTTPEASIWIFERGQNEWAAHCSGKWPATSFSEAHLPIAVADAWSKATEVFKTRAAAVQSAAKRLRGFFSGERRTREIVEWLDRQSGPYFVDGIDCLNASNAQERRFAIGWDKRASNTAGSAKSKAPSTLRDDDALADSRADDDRRQAQLYLIEIAYSETTQPVAAGGHDWALTDGYAYMSKGNGQLHSADLVHYEVHEIGVRRAALFRLTQAGWDQVLVLLEGARLDEVAVDKWRGKVGRADQEPNDLDDEGYFTRTLNAARTRNVIERQTAEKAVEDVGGIAAPHPIVSAAPQTHPTNAALQLLAIERARQVEAEGWTPLHDDESNAEGEIAAAAAAYALGSIGARKDALDMWPADWDEVWFKSDGSLRDLVKAGALILAEIERRQRAEATA